MLIVITLVLSSEGEVKHQMEEQAAVKILAAHQVTDLEVEASGDGDEVYDSDSTWSECASDGWDNDSEMSCSSDASVEGNGLMAIDMTFLKRYRSEYWLRDRDDTVAYRIRCLHEDLGLWLARWGGVDNWRAVSLNPERIVEVRAQMALGVSYAELIGQVWNAEVMQMWTASEEVRFYWERTAKMMTKLFEALSLLGQYMDWDSDTDWDSD